MIRARGETAVKADIWMLNLDSSSEEMSIGSSSRSSSLFVCLGVLTVLVFSKFLPASWFSLRTLAVASSLSSSSETCFVKESVKPSMPSFRIESSLINALSLLLLTPGLDFSTYTI